MLPLLPTAHRHPQGILHRMSRGNAVAVPRCDLPVQNFRSMLARWKR